MTILLGVNIDHVATLRQARGTVYPDPIQAALMAENAGADSITVHLREDRRHIQDVDVQLLKDLIKVPMNLEMAVTDEMLAFAEKIRPKHVCLVPERREELTTEGGLDVIGQRNRIWQASQRLAQAGIEVSLFIDPEIAQIEAAIQCEVPAIEIHTGAYADTLTPQAQTAEFYKIQKAAVFAQQKNLIVNAGHGLNYNNVQSIAEITELTVLNIGHSIIARAIFTGLKIAVHEMKELILISRNTANAV